MKKIMLIVFAGLMVSCNNNESLKKENEVTSLQKFQNDWLKANVKSAFKLNEKTSKTEATPSAYVFSKSELVALLDTPNVNKLRFVLGITNNSVDVKVSVLSGVQTKVLHSEIYSDENLKTQLNALQTSDFIYASENAAINNYFLKNDAAYAQYNNLANITDNNVLENVVSYNSERIKHFAIEKLVIEELLTNVNFSKLAVVFASNPQGKLSPIVFGLDTQNNFITHTNVQARGTGVIIIGDFLPCPSHCD